MTQYPIFPPEGALGAILSMEAQARPDDGPALEQSVRSECEHLGVVESEYADCVMDADTSEALDACNAAHRKRFEAGETP